MYHISYIHCFCILSVAFDDDTQTRLKTRELTLREKQAICHQTHQKVLHIASGQWPKTHCQFCQGVYQGKEMESFRLPKQSPDLNPIEHEFHQLKRRLKAEQAIVGISCFKGWETHSKGWDQESGDVLWVTDSLLWLHARDLQLNNSF